MNMFKKGENTFKKYFPNGIMRTCIICKKPFISVCANGKYCHNPCVHEKNNKKRYLRYLKYITIKQLRSAFYECYRRDPNLAEKLYDEMLKEEGEKFTNMALNGIITKENMKQKLKLEVITK